MDLAKKLYELRKQNNMTQEQLAEKLNVSRQSVSKWESGVAYPEMDKLLAICKIFKCPLDVLTGDNELRCETEEKKGYFNKFLTTVNQIFTMFTKLKFSDLLKIFLEFVLLISLMALFRVTILEMLVGLIRNLFGVLPENGRMICNSILTFIVNFTYLIICFIIIGYLFNERYLKNYEELVSKNTNTDTPSEKDEETDSGKEEKENIQYVYLPKSNFSIIDIIAKGVIWFVKFIILWFLIADIGVIFGLVVLLVGDIWLMTEGVFLSSLLFGLIAGTILCIEFLIIMINFLFNKKSNYRLLLWVFIGGLVGISISFGVGILEFTDFRYLTELPDRYKGSAESLEIPMNDELYIDDWVEYHIDEARDNILIEYENNIFYDLEIINDDNYIRTYTNEVVDFKEIKNFVLDCLKSKTFYGVDYPVVNVYANSKNIETLKENNVIARENENLYYDDEMDYLNNEITRLQEEIEILKENHQEEIQEYQRQIDEYQEKIRDLEEILK